MSANRRTFLRRMAASGLVLKTLASGDAGPRKRIKAVAFDAFPILDPRPVFALDELFPGHGADLSNLWRTRQFEYMWLRTISGNYADFRQVTEDALAFSAKALKLDLTRQKRTSLMQAYLELRCWPEVPAALRALKSARIRLAFLSNMTMKMLEAGIRNSQLEGVFEHVLTTDNVKAFKPDPRAYQMGLDSFHLERDEILFAAFAGWDAAGAGSFGYPTFWVNRLNQPAEELAPAPDATGTTLNDLVAFFDA